MGNLTLRKLLNANTYEYELFEPQPVTLKKEIRIVSFLPSATEIIYYLGLLQYLKGVTFECDWPEKVHALPKVVQPKINTNVLSSQEVDYMVKRTLATEGSLYKINTELLMQISPDVIITQNLCPVCAVSEHNIKECLGFNEKVKIVTLSPLSVADVLKCIVEVAKETGIEDVGVRVYDRLYESYRKLVKDAKNYMLRRRCLFIEWLHPLYIAGNWVAQILNDFGAFQPINLTCRPSKAVSYKLISDFLPDVIIFSLCGRKGEILKKEVEAFLNNKYVVDTPAYRNKCIYIVPEELTAKPGPRIILGARVIFEILYKPEKAERFAISNVKKQKLLTKKTTVG